MENARFYKVYEEPFEVFGLYGNVKTDGFKRLPDNIGQNVNDRVKELYKNTAGGRIRFATNAQSVIVKISGGGDLPWHMTNAMRHGADVYIDGAGESRFAGTLCIPVGVREYKQEIVLGSGKKEITVFLPLYGDVVDIEIGLPEDAEVYKHTAYKHDLPVVFYGSSITQGACASRAGRAYQSIISRKYDLNYINLGFSGAARAEDIIVDYMAGLEMSAFVSDYDHNAPSHEHLKNTHHRMYERIREKHPDIPYFMITRPDFYFNEDCRTRRAIIMQSYLDARAKGDKNVYFIDGSAFFNGETVGDLTLEGTHPNDVGFARMAAYIGDVMAKIMKL